MVGTTNDIFDRKISVYKPGEIDMILTDLHSTIICIPPAWNTFGKLQFSHASLSDFPLDRSHSMDLFLNEGAAHAKLTGLAVKHNDPTESQRSCKGASSSFFCGCFIDSMKMKPLFIVHFGGVVSELVHSRSSLRSCVGLTKLLT